MPFIPKKDRKSLLDYKKSPSKPGEYCFLEYEPLIKAWKEEKRWTTIHNQYKRLMGVTHIEAAKFLAFLEFYLNYGHPYEKKMKKRNGDIR